MHLRTLIVNLNNQQGQNSNLKLWWTQELPSMMEMLIKVVTTKTFDAAPREKKPHNGQECKAKYKDAERSQGLNMSIQELS